MALREIRTLGDPILTKPCKKVTEVTPRIKELIEDLYDTMYDAQGVGLAAPQVGVLRRVCVVDIGEGSAYTFINPELIVSDGEQTGDEGCLSYPGKAGKVTRPNHIVVRYYDIDLNEQTLEADEMLARAVCHEIDHLDGHMYVEKVEGEIFEVQEEEEETTGKKKKRKRIL